MDADVFEHETEQLLAALEVEGVDAVQGVLGEVGHGDGSAIVDGRDAEVCGGVAGGMLARPSARVIPPCRWA